MGRPIKQTVEWFSHDANASGGRTLSILYNHFQHEGVSAWWQLLERLCSTNSHFINIRSSEDFEFLASGMRFSPERLRAILDKMAELSAIDVSLYRNGIVWSNNLVIRLSNVYKSRNQPLPVKPVLFDIIGVGAIVKLQETELLPKETELLPKETELLPKESTLEREREIGTKERKKGIAKKTYGELNNVLLSDNELDKLKERFNSHYSEKIENLSLWLASSGKKKADHYATILSWDRRDKESGMLKNNMAKPKIGITYKGDPEDEELK